MLLIKKYQTTGRFFLEKYSRCTGRICIQGHQESNPIKEDEMAEFVDTLLEDQDRNDDGYIDYPEFIASFKHTPSHSSDGTNTAV